MCPCGKAVESRTHIVGECKMYEEGRDVLKGEMRQIDECDMENFGTLDNRAKEMYGVHRRRNTKGINLSLIHI